MIVKCPDCGEKHIITKNSPRITKNIVGEFFVVCNKPLVKYPWVSNTRKKSCNGYIVIDIEELEKEVDID